MANQPILQKYSVTITGEPAGTYYFQTSYGVYTGTIATATGVTAPTESTQDAFDAAPLVSVKELIRVGALVRKYVEVSDANSGNRWIKTLLCSGDKILSFDDAIITDAGVNWPVGKGAGVPITDTVNRRRVTGRQ